MGETEAAAQRSDWKDVFVGVLADFCKHFYGAKSRSWTPATEETQKSEVRPTETDREKAGGQPRSSGKFPWVKSHGNWLSI